MKNNKLIAEFMELETEIFSSGIPNYYYRDIAEGSFFEEHELSYNVSWDWLMTVVEKIENFGYEFIIVESRCCVKHNTDHSIEEVFHMEGKVCSKLKTTYEAVVEFINRYNKKQIR